MLLIGTLFSAAQLFRWQDTKRRTEANFQQLIHALEPDEERFSADTIADLPEQVQRFFRYSIRAGAKLHNSAELDMTGTFSFGQGRGELPLRAHQVLRAPRGMIWKADIGSKLSAISGSDGILGESSWTQFALFDLFPVALIGNDRDHYQSAVSRMLAEAVFWTPAALLRTLPVTWESDTANQIRATIAHGELATSVEIKLKENGCPLEISFQRWSDANPAKTYRMQAFGGFLSGFREIDGITVPMHVEAGNFFGTDDYFPFYKVDVQNFKWLN